LMCVGAKAFPGNGRPTQERAVEGNSHEPRWEADLRERDFASSVRARVHRPVEAGEVRLGPPPRPPGVSLPAGLPEAGDPVESPCEVRRGLVEREEGHTRENGHGCGPDLHEIRSWLWGYVKSHLPAPSAGNAAYQGRWDGYAKPCIGRRQVKPGYRATGIGRDGDRGMERYARCSDLKPSTRYPGQGRRRWSSRVTMRNRPPLQEALKRGLCPCTSGCDIALQSDREPRLPHQIAGDPHRILAVVDPALVYGS
jgi:hypothetical protein